MKLYRHYLTLNNCYKAAKKVKQKGILVHDTGAGNKNLSRYIDDTENFGVNKYGNHWNQPMPSGINVCVHAFIGVDKSGNVCTCETLPYEYSCWGCGKGTKGSYNYDPTAHIQFEICDDGYKDKGYFEKAFKEATEYCAFLCKKFKFDPMTDIVSHKEAHDLGYGSNHGDCDGWLKKFGYTMDDFRQWVYNEMNPKKPVKAEPVKAFEPYIVKITAGLLNVRKGAGTTFPIAGVVKKGESHTIIAEEKIGSVIWGKLKSGAGWIGLTGYTEKIK